MKKVVSLLLVTVMLLCCTCFSGCSKKEIPNPTPNDLVDALEEGGFGALYIPDDWSEYLPSFEDKSRCIDLSNNYGDMDIYISTDVQADQQIIRGLDIENYSGSEDQEDAIKILNIIMPLFDDDFNNGGEEIITNLEKLSEDKSNAQEFEVLDSLSYYFSYEYHGFTFHKWTDENYNDEYITILGLLESYLKKNNMTHEEYYNQFKEQS